MTHGQCEATLTITFPACVSTRSMLLGDRLMYVNNSPKVAQESTAAGSQTRDMLITSRDAPIMHWPIIGRPIIGAKQSADYRPITD